jgi:hypothetical protein
VEKMDLNVGGHFVSVAGSGEKEMVAEKSLMEACFE